MSKGKVPNPHDTADVPVDVQLEVTFCSGIWNGKFRWYEDDSLKRSNTWKGFEGSCPSDFLIEEVLDDVEDWIRDALPTPVADALQKGLQSLAYTAVVRLPSTEPQFVDLKDEKVKGKLLSDLFGDASESTNKLEVMVIWEFERRGLFGTPDKEMYCKIDQYYGGGEDVEGRGA